jgi:hypothetical protein
LANLGAAFGAFTTGFLTSFLGAGAAGASVAAFFSAFAAADAYLLSSSKLTFSKLALVFMASCSTSVLTTSAAYAKLSGGFSSGVTPI